MSEEEKIKELTEIMEEELQEDLNEKIRWGDAFRDYFKEYGLDTEDYTFNISISVTKKED